MNHVTHMNGWLDYGMIGWMAWLATAHSAMKSFRLVATSPMPRLLAAGA